MSTAGRGHPTQPDPAATKRSWLGPVLITGVALCLYLPGINWGLPALVSWSQDTIAGVRTLGAVETWPDRWAGRYPPLQYFVVRAAYGPVLAYWTSTGQAAVDPQTGRLHFAAPHPPKVGLLILIARIISAIMAAAAVAALWLATRALTGDALAAHLAALAFSIQAGFVYFAHLGNVDVPSVLWFAVSLVFFARLLQSGSVRDAALLGLFGACCVSTKDNWAGVYAGMAVVLLIARGQSHGLRRAVFHWPWLVGTAAFALPYAFVNGLFWNPQRWMDRLRALADTVHHHEFRHESQLSLLAETLVQGATAAGWPLLVAMVAAAGFAIVRQPRPALCTLIPCLSYYLIVISQIRFVYERFLFAPLALLCILTGAGGAALIRHHRLPAIFRFGVPTAVFLLTLGYAVAVDLEMLNDSRYAAEHWFAENVAEDATVGALTATWVGNGREQPGQENRFSPQYLPRLHELGFTTYAVPAQRESFERLLPDYLVLSSFDEQDFDDAARQFVNLLRSGRLGFAPVAVFRGRHLGYGSSWLSLAGWLAPPPGKISPTITVFGQDGSGTGPGGP